MDDKKVKIKSVPETPTKTVKNLNSYKVELAHYTGVIVFLPGETKKISLDVVIPNSNGLIVR